MTPTCTPLFALRAAASRASRKVKRFNRRFYAVKRDITTALYWQMENTLKRLAFHADVLRHRYYDAAIEQQRANMARMGRNPDSGRFQARIAA